MAGEVFVGEHRVDKPAAEVAADAPVRIEGRERYVSRGGLKLEAALAAFGIDPTGRVCLDIGASTGGFTDCLLQHGAVRIHAIDVGHGQLDWKVRTDPRVVVRESSTLVSSRPATWASRWNLRGRRLLHLADFDLATGLRGANDNGRDCRAESSRSSNRDASRWAKGDVREAAAHEAAVEKVRAFVTGQLGRTWAGVIESPILGGQGNKEFLACLRP